ncbi:phospholipase D family protein [Methylobacterium sp. DCY52]|jgi:HKD family nuclease|uniref:phospholipase D family protein n=1 Tax=Methylobacterium sp. DCY52 TaxID=739139 RepID=UPI003144DCEB
MRLVVQSPTRPERIISALEDMIEEDTSAIRLAVAYVTLSGTDLLIERMVQKLGEQKWNRVNKQIITCFDFGFTEPEALTKWMSLPGSSVRAQNAELVLEGNLNPKTAFHVKMYEFRTDAYANLMVGSANLSERALSVNSEAATVHTGISKLKSLNANWKRMRFGSAVVDAALIAAYDALRTANPPPPAPPIASPATVPAQSLWDALQAGGCDPSGYEYFWVDAGYLSGGSVNQLELPRGANTYFGFAFDDYDRAQESIGSVGLAVRSAFHANRPLSWHGDNRMERINLPTGESYAGNVMLFRRRARHFELTWAQIGSQRAFAWASASEAAGQRHKVGQKGNRTCGLF